MKRLLLAALLLFLAACGSEKSASDDKGNENQAGQGATTESTSTNQPSVAPSDQHFPAGDFAARHILVSYQGARGVTTDVTRSKEEARAHAEDLLERLLDNPAAFEEIAAAESDRPQTDGSVEVLTWDRSPQFKQIQDPLEKVATGDIVPEPLEFPDGYYIFQRLEPKQVKYYTGAAFFISFAGHPESPPHVTRTREEARALAQSLSSQLTTENFMEMARKHNDLDPNGGATSLGIIQTGARVPPGFLDALENLAFDGVGGPAEMPFGFAFIKRYKVERLRGAHILVSHVGATNARPHITRNEEEARALAAKLIEQTQGQPSEVFRATAVANSDGPSAPNGGNLGTWYRGQMVLDFDLAILDLEPGQISPEPVKTTFGYHVILRLP